MIIKQTFTIHGAEGKPILMDLTYKTGSEHAPVALFVHGFKGFKDWGCHNLVAERFAERGLRYVKFNFSHNGTTPDQPEEFADLGAFSDNTFTKEFYDLDQVISFVKSGQEFPAPQSLTLIGHSRGGGSCIVQAANDERVDKLITWAAVGMFNSLWKPEQEDEWREKGVIYNYNARTKQYTPLKIDLLHDLEKHAKSYDVSVAASRIDIPWLIIHGDQDVNVDLQIAKDLSELSENAKLFIVESADHVFGAVHPYLDEQLPPPLQLVCEKSIEFAERPVV